MLTAKSQSLPIFAQNGMLSEAGIDEIYSAGMDTGGLDFSGSNLSQDQPFQIADLLVSNKLVSIVHIDLSGARINVDGFQAVLFAAAEVKSLESFVCRKIGLTADAGMALSKILCAKGCLRILDASENHLGDVGVSNLSGAFSFDHTKALQKHCVSVMTLTVLDLSHNNITDVGMLALCRGLSQLLRRAANVGLSLALKVLRLQNNHLTDKSALCLAQLLNTPTSSGANNGPQLAVAASPTLELEELGLSGNTSLTVRGISALLPGASDGMQTTVKRLLVANTQITPAVLNHLSANLEGWATLPVSRGQRRTALEHIDFGVTVEQVLNLILGNYEGRDDTRPPLQVLCEAVRRLALAIDAFAVVEQAPHVDLGVLHSTLFNYAAHLQTDAGADGSAAVGETAAQVDEIVRTLEACNQSTAVTSALGLAVVPNVAQWVRSAVYECDPESAAYKAAAEVKPAQVIPSAEQGRASVPVNSAAVLMAPALAASPTFKSTFLSTFTTTLGDNKDLDVNGVLGIKPSIPPVVASPPAAAPTGDASPLRLSTVGTNHLLAQTLFSAEAEYRTAHSAPTTVSPSAAPASPLGAEEQAYLRLRQEHSTALHDLSSEIDRVAHLHAGGAPSAPIVAPSTQLCTAEEPTVAADSLDDAHVSSGRNTMLASPTVPLVTPHDSTHHPGDESAKRNDEPSLVQIIGYMQAQVTSLAQKQQLYEVNFTHKFSDLEFRIEAMEAALRLSHETQLAMQLEQSSHADPTIEQTGPAAQVMTRQQAVEEGRQRESVQHPTVVGLPAGLQDPSFTAIHRAQAAAPPPGPTSPDSLSASAMAMARRVHTHNGVANELLISDLMARLEVVEGRMLQDRATALQSALNKQFQQERLQQRQDVLELLVERSGHTPSPVARRSPQNAQHSTVPPVTAHGSPYHLQGSPYAHRSPYLPPGYPSPQLLHQLPPQYLMYPGAAPYIPASYTASGIHASPQPPPPPPPVPYVPRNALPTTQPPAAAPGTEPFTPYVPAPSPYVPEDPAHAHRHHQHHSLQEPQQDQQRSVWSSYEAADRHPPAHDNAEDAQAKGQDGTYARRDDAVAAHGRGSPAERSDRYEGTRADRVDTESVQSEASQHSWPEKASGRQVDRALFPVPPTMSVKDRDRAPTGTGAARAIAAASAAAPSAPGAQFKFNVKTGTLSPTTDSAEDTPAVNQAPTNTRQPRSTPHYHHYGAPEATPQDGSQDDTASTASHMSVGSDNSLRRLAYGHAARRPESNSRDRDARAPAESRTRATEAIAEENMLNYSVINNISRNSISMSVDALNESQGSIVGPTSMLDRYRDAHQQRVAMSVAGGRPPRSVTISAELPTTGRAKTPPASRPVSRGKTPGFMLPTASNAHKVTTGKTSYGQGHLGSTH